MYFTGFACTSCDATYGATEDLLLCRKCASLLEATYNLVAIKRELDRDAVSRRSGGVWAWQDFLPIVDTDAIVTLGEGGTPMLRCERLARLIGVRELWVKVDAANPTGSLKDRSITVSATKAVEFGYRVLSCDSTGNKASSVAAYAARAGLASVVFCPEDTPVPKVTQSLFFGAKVIRVRGHYAQINAMYRRLIHSGRLKWYDCGTDNPYRYEGKKTYAYEIARDFGWEVPDRIIHPANGGMSIAKTWKGFRELHQLGWIDCLPRMSGVQAAACGPIVRSWRAGDRIVTPIEKKPTVAGALAGADPGLLGARALGAIYDSRGAMVGVDDREIFEAMKLLALEGLFIEPSGAVSIAGLRRLLAEGQVNRDERVVCVVTGSGFKDSERIAEQVEIPREVVEGYEEMLAAAERVN
jgi:threonine synthase